MGKAKNIINSCTCTMKDALNELENAKCCCEKDSNKEVIQSAINSLNLACDKLSNYND